MTTFLYEKWSFCLPERGTRVRFIAVTNDQLSIERLIEVLIDIEPFIDHAIIREKNKSMEQLGTLYSHLEKIGFPMEKCIVHNHPKLAERFNIPFVQLPGTNLQLKNDMKANPNCQFGQSIHSVEEAVVSQSKGASYVLYGHIFPTACKKDIPARGTKAIIEMLQMIDIPLYVIGGILPSHVSNLKRIGVSGIAVMSTIFEHENPKSIAKEYDEAIKIGVRKYDEGYFT